MNISPMKNSKLPPLIRTSILRTICLFFLSHLAMAGQVFAYESVSWIDESMIHDGRLLKVERQASNSLDFELYWMLPPIFRFQPSNFDEHRIEFRHPDTNERVVWNGERYFTPVRVDVIGGTPYLVIYGRPDKKTEKIYGCPELPYIYLKYLRHDWIPVPVHEAPKELLKGNLSVYDFRSKEGRQFDWRKVEFDVDFNQRQSGGQMQAIIPRSYDEWHTSFKNSARNERFGGDCRPPPQPLPDIDIPKPTDIPLEEIETYYFDEPGSREHYQSIRRMPSAISRANCSSLFKLADKENTMLGERFVKDPTGNKRLPYTGPIPVPTGQMLEQRTWRYCSEKFVWFVAEREEVGKTMITKYSVSGDVQYNVRITNPDTAGIKLISKMVLDSVSAEDGHLYFYWERVRSAGQAKTVKYRDSITRFRFKEPM